VLPFGLKTAVGSFSRAMNVILGPEVREFTVNDIDDLLIVSDSFEQHLQHLDKVLSRLQDAKMTINLEKSSFLQEEVRFLGHILSSNGVGTDPEKVKAIQEFLFQKRRNISEHFWVCADTIDGSVTAIAMPSFLSPGCCEGRQMAVDRC
jgi:hypothetical protein